VTEEELPPSVRAVTEAYRATVDRLVPGLVTGLYLTGSVALGDYRHGRSDVDFVAVCAQRPDVEAVGALREAHAEIRARFPAPAFEGIYVVGGDLAAGPDACPDVPYHHNGALQPSGRFNLNPIIWHELADHAVTLVGPSPFTLDVWTDDKVLRGYCHDNLVRYWTPWAHRVWHPGDHPFTASVGLAAVEWAVLGVARLHATIATGRILTKTAGGAYARDRFDPRWHGLIDTALRVRSGQAGLGDRAAAPRLRHQRRAFVAMVIEDANALR
jgi:hypothetical protein